MILAPRAWWKKAVGAPPIFLCICYAVSGMEIGTHALLCYAVSSTEIRYGATHSLHGVRYQHGFDDIQQVLASSYAMSGSVIAYCDTLAYAMSGTVMGTVIAYCDTLAYAISGTVIAYRVVLPYAMSAYGGDFQYCNSTYRPTRALCDVPYSPTLCYHPALKPAVLLRNVWYWLCYAATRDLSWLSLLRVATLKWMQGSGLR
eukprot:1777217-Rhodomonas_salina.1